VAGLTDSGLEVKRLSEIVSDVSTRLSDALGTSIDLSRARSVLGVVTLSLARSAAEAWTAIQQLYDARSPDTATGDSLDALCALVGVYREPAVAAEVVLGLTGSPGVTIPAGKLARSSVSGRTFELLETVTLDRVGTGSARFRAEVAEAIFEPLGAISEIVTPTAGWDTVSNSGDLSGGSDAETDAELRLRRQRSLSIVGAGTDLAISSRVEALDSVAEARVVSNRTPSIVDGRPPHSFELLVWPASGAPPLLEAEEEEIATVSGFVQRVAFSYVEELALFAELDLVVDDTYAGDVATQAAVSELGNAALGIGDDVWVVDLLAQIAELDGVLGADLRVGDAASPTERLRFAVAVDKIGRFDSSRVVISSTPVS